MNHDNRIGELNEEFYRIQNQIDKCTEQINFLQTKFSDLALQEQEYQNNKIANSNRKEGIIQEQIVIDEEIAVIKQKLSSDQTELLAREQELAA